MKMYEVTVSDQRGTSKYFVGKIEKEYLVMVFGDKAIVKEVELPENKSSAKLIGDE
jgi:hypothetical protein